MSIIEISGLKKTYGRNLALQGANLSVEEGELFGLLGPNGAGKTTLISILSTLIPFDDGAVVVSGKRLPGAAPFVRSVMGAVPQHLALYERFTARSNLNYFGGLYGLSGRALRIRVEEALDTVGLTDTADKKVATYSGGMKRRLNLAVGLVHRPRILLLDEPTVGVDPQSRMRIFDAIRQINEEQRITIIYTTHYMEEVEHLCNRVAILDHGQVIASGTVPQLLQQAGPSVISVGVNHHASMIIPCLERLPVIEQITAADGRLEMTTNRVEDALPALFEVLRQHKVALENIELRRPSLGQLFMALTGKALRD